MDGESITPAVRIVSKCDGFWRAGMPHPSHPVVHPAGTFTVQQLATLEGDPMLDVSRIEVVAPQGDPDDAPAAPVFSTEEGELPSSAPRRSTGRRSRNR